MGVRLSREEAEKIIRNLENKGEDASHLKQALDDVYHHASSPESSNGLTDEELVTQLLEKSPVQEGESLTCPLCTNKVSKLFSGVCLPCFRPWALKTKKEK